MSLLDSANVDVVVYLEEHVTDEDGNIRTRPSATGIPTRCRIQPVGQSGTSARRAEQDNEGFESEKYYSVRFPRAFPHVLNAQSQIEWQGKRWAVVGDRTQYLGSAATRHEVYTIRRF